MQARQARLRSQLDGIEEPDKLVTVQLFLLPHFGSIRCEAKHMRHFSLLSMVVEDEINIFTYFT